jgi:hypothetical protein
MLFGATSQVLLFDPSAIPIPQLDDDTFCFSWFDEQTLLNKIDDTF